VPRLVDHTSRREAVTQALWQVVRRSGIHAVSVRTVAAEAGISPSALRHYFASQDELLGFALQAVVARVEARLVPSLPDLSGTEGARTILDQFLPLDEERRAEIEVYLAFIGRAHTDARLRAIRDVADARAREAIRLAVTLLDDAGAFGRGRDHETETSRLYALLDGLAMHGALMSDRYPPEHLRQILGAQLRELAGPVV
jgi:AcrR family transcriptional regulator